MFGLSVGKLIALGVLVLGILSAIGTGVYKIKQWGANEVRAEWNAEKEARAQQALVAANNREGDLGNAKVIYKTIETRVKEYIDRPVYRAECIDDDGLRDINDALRGRITQPNGPVPGPSRPTR